MRIDNTMNAYLRMARQPPSADATAMRHHNTQPETQQANRTSRPWITVDISPEGLAAYAKSETTKNVKGMEKLAALTECKTCKSRKYQDGSNDPSVSFQTPTNISPGQSAALVLAHEYEHVSNDKAKAEEEGRRVISQTVKLESSICPECGRIYISGGVTRTVTAKESD
jgi:hypothetical protein